jgi:hypothetical protein
VNDDKNISRSDVLQKLAFAPIAIGAFAALQSQAEAAATMDQKTAAYVGHAGPGGQKCSGCSLFIPGKSMKPGTCKLVKGSIAPGGYCKFWSKK